MFTARHIHRAALTTGIGCVLLLTSVIGTAAAQDLRSPDTRDAARTSSLAGTTERAQDLRSPDARDAAEGLLPGQANWPGHELPPAPELLPGTPSDDMPWLPIALALAVVLAGATHLYRLRVRRRLATS